MRIVILNGFDRSGTSLVGGLLRKHSSVNYLFQPFAHSEVKRQQHEIWPPECPKPITAGFFEGLLRGRLDRDYVTEEFLGCDVFMKNSSSDRILPDKLNLIKETKLHLKIPWIKTRFPEIGIFGIWRDPRAVVCSLMRNDYYRQWYGQRAYAAVAGLVGREPCLRRFFPHVTRRPKSDLEKMALIVAVHQYYMSLYLDEGQYVFYEDVLEDASGILSRFLRRFGLDEHNFSEYVAHDFNVAGKPFAKEDLWREWFCAEEIASLDRLFHGIGPARSHQEYSRHENRSDQN